MPEDGLYLVHYTPDADLVQFGELRGTIVDLNARCIICQSFGFTPTAVVDQITPDDQGVVVFNDTTGREHIVDLNRATIKCGFEGTIMRVFLHNGTVYRATHRRINPINSRWGDSVAFNAMYDELRGPADNVMFDLTQGRYSPYVHIYLMVHPDVLSCSKQEVGSGYMVYLGVRQAYPTEPELSPYRQTEPAIQGDTRLYSGPIDPAIRMPIGLTSIPIPIEGNGPFLLELFDWTLEQANDHLRYGFYEPFDMETELTDTRLGCGEFVMMYKYDDEGRLSGLLRVVSPAYQWRSDIRDNNPNILHRLYQLINASYVRAETVSGLEEFKARYPLIFPYQPDSIVERIRGSPMVIWTQDDAATDVIVSSKDERFCNVWVCLLMAVPLHKQLETALMYGQVISERGRIIDWLRGLYSSEKYKNDARLLPRASAIVSQALKFAQQKTALGHNRDRYGKVMSVDQLTADNIRNLVSKEKGDSLYRLAKAMKE